MTDTERIAQLERHVAALACDVLGVCDAMRDIALAVRSQGASINELACCVYGLLQRENEDVLPGEQVASEANDAGRGAPVRRRSRAH